MKPINLGPIGGTGPEFVRRHCRNTDPATSRKAAIKAERFAHGQSALILQTLRRGKPLCSKEIGDLIGLKSEQVTRRIKALVDANLIKDTGLEREGCRVLECIQ